MAPASAGACEAGEAIRCVFVLWVRAWGVFSSNFAQILVRESAWSISIDPPNRLTNERGSVENNNVERFLFNHHS